MAQFDGVRAGLWRRGLALAIDSIVISALFQLTVAVLFVATSGRVQMFGDVSYASCSKIEAAPGVTVHTPPALAPLLAGARSARQCNVYFLGAQTASILQVERAEKADAADQTAWKNYRVDRNGQPVESVSVDLMVAAALFVYLVVMETRTGATLGRHMMRTRVIDAAAPERRGVPFRKVLARYSAMAIGFIPLLGGALIGAGPPGVLDALNAFYIEVAAEQPFLGDIGSLKLQWRPVLAAFFFELPQTLLSAGEQSFHGKQWLLELAYVFLYGWIIFLIVQIAMKKDPLYDKMAGVAVAHNRQDDDDALKS